jgi:integrase
MAGTGAAIYSVTVGELLDDLLRDYKLGQKDYGWAERVVRLHIRPNFGDLSASSVKTSDLRHFTDEQLEKGDQPATVNRSLALLRRAFNLGRKASPPKVARMPNFELLPEQNARQGFLEPVEYRAILRELPAHLQPVLTFAYFTGCRRGEILGLRWDQVDLDTGVVRLLAGETKNGEGRTIPLASEVIGMLKLQSARREANFPKVSWVFCDKLGEKVVDIMKYWRTACKRSGFIDSDGKPTKMLHDCRRSAVRNMVRSGTPEIVCMAVSGHKTRSIFDRYNIVSEVDLTAAARRLSAHLQTLEAEATARENAQADAGCHTLVTQPVN